MTENRCVCCGEIIPEGWMACPNCLVVVKKAKTCENCIHVEVCGKYQATGGHVRNCKHWLPRLHPQIEESNITDQTIDALNKMGKKVHRCSE